MASSSVAEVSKDFTFARLTDLHKINLTFKVTTLVGKRPKRRLTELLEKPELRHAGAEASRPADLFLTAQLWASNKPLTPVFRTSHKACPSSPSPSSTLFSFQEHITLPIPLSNLPLDAQVVFTIYEIGGPPRARPAVLGGTTFRLFSKKCTLKKAQHRLLVHPGVEGDGSDDSATPSKLPRGPDVTEEDEMGRLEKLMKRQQRGDLPQLDWLDKMAYRAIERVHATETEKSDKLYLYIDLPRFDFPVVFCEPESLLPLPNPPPAPVPHPPSTVSNTVPSSEAFAFTIVDPDMPRENPVEAKHRRLVRSHRSGPLDRELKPNAKLRDELNAIVSYPPTQPLTPAEKDLVWKFRFYLTRDKRALTKFLKSVEWTDPAEVKQATEILLPIWTDPEVDDALELLGPGFPDGRVRAYAVRLLGRADDEELILYLLQLVQALKFEPVAPARSSRAPPSPAHNDSGLADLLISRAVRNPVLGNSFYWYLMVECGDRVVGRMFAKVAHKFMQRLMESENGAERRDVLRRQAELVETLNKRAKELRASKDARPKKIEKLRGFISDSKNCLSSFAPMPLPLDARVTITGIDAERSSVFKSNLYPLLLYFRTEGDRGESGHYPLIFKNGDDLRQDQLVIQLFTLMDRLLRKENLDLRLMPYRVLATDASAGMVQFVPSKTLAAIVSEHGSLLAYMRASYPNEDSPVTFGVEPSVLDTFVRSCAGYCVVTYLLGVGDRHLDNLLLSPDGHFFHVDFGYILGRDPKPFPPPVKVCKEMVDAMGGPGSPHYNRFKSLCYTAFTSLRKNANLILNLVALMSEADIPDIKLEPDKAVMKVQEKFRLDLSEEEAIKAFETLLNETSYLSAVFDRIHDIAQYWRS